MVKTRRGIQVAGGVSKRRSGKLSRASAGYALPSAWQEPPSQLLDRIFSYLLTQPDGNQHVSEEKVVFPFAAPKSRFSPADSSVLPFLGQVRMASLVCSYWRAAAQDVLLADTAVSKPARCATTQRVSHLLLSNSALCSPPVQREDTSLCRWHPQPFSLCRCTMQAPPPPPCGCATPLSTPGHRHSHHAGSSSS